MRTSQKAGLSSVAGTLFSASPLSLCAVCLLVVQSIQMRMSYVHAGRTLSVSIAILMALIAFTWHQASRAALSWELPVGWERVEGICRGLAGGADPRGHPLTWQTACEDNYLALVLNNSVIPVALSLSVLAAFLAIKPKKRIKDRTVKDSSPIRATATDVRKRTRLTRVSAIAATLGSLFLLYANLTKRNDVRISAGWDTNWASFGCPPEQWARDPRLGYPFDFFGKCDGLHVVALAIDVIIFGAVVYLAYRLWNSFLSSKRKHR